MNRADSQLNGSKFRHSMPWQNECAARVCLVNLVNKHRLFCEKITLNILTNNSIHCTWHTLIGIVLLKELLHHGVWVIDIQDALAAVSCQEEWPDWWLLRKSHKGMPSGRQHWIASTNESNRQDGSWKLWEKEGCVNAWANWNLPGNFQALKTAVIMDIARCEDKEESDNTCGISNQSGVPRLTLFCHAKCFQDAATKMWLKCDVQSLK